MHNIMADNRNSPPAMPYDKPVRARLLDAEFAFGRLCIFIFSIKQDY